MKLDVVVPTYNRSGLLRHTLASLARASLPAELQVTVIVVDNNSQDDTRQVIEQQQAAANLPLVYLRETRQGLSHARNAGLAAGSGEIIGFIDDDEEIAKNWFEVIAREFHDPETLFIGGPYLANGELALPAWLPAACHSVIGVHTVRPRALYTRAFPGNLNGGNAVLRRSVFAQVGVYNVRLGRSARGLLSEEDAELYHRILAAGLRGIYVPDLVIYHHLPASRLTRRYYRSWFYWRGISRGIADREKREPLPYLLGVPRYRIRQALAGLVSIPSNLGPRRGSPAAFYRELAFWDLLGFLRGKFLGRIDSLYADQA